MTHERKGRANPVTPADGVEKGFYVQDEQLKRIELGTEFVIRDKVGQRAIAAHWKVAEHTGVTHKAVGHVSLVSCESLGGESIDPNFGLVRHSEGEPGVFYATQVVAALDAEQEYQEVQLAKHETKKHVQKY